MSDFGSHYQFKSANNVDNIVLKYIQDTFNVKTMIDIGCGQGKQVESAREMGIDAIGVDGSPALTIYDKPYFFRHDYTKGKAELGDFDLGWSVEFLEHVYEKYIPNFLDTFAKCKIVFCTHAVPGQGGTHHVNCQTDEYWIDVFQQYGFKYNKEISLELREMAECMFVQLSGMFLEKIIE